MNKLNYVIYSPGRTGSVAIATAVSSWLHDRHIVIETDYTIINTNINFASGLVFHTHSTSSLDSVTDKSKWVAIISRRRNDFDGIIGALVAKYTQEYTDVGPNSYSKKKIEPTIFEKADFFDYYRHRKDFYKILNLNEYNKVIDIYLEDMIMNSYYLLETLGFGHQEITYKQDKNPRKSVDLVMNIEELKQYWIELESTDKHWVNLSIFPDGKVITK